jgi:hypothetical protein
MRETCEVEEVADGKTHKHGAKTLQRTPRTLTMQ